MDIPEEYKIYDSRTQKSFKDTTICNYLKKDVLSAFNKALLNGKIEESCNWAIELLCSGHVDKVYDKIYAYITKYINITNPYLAEIFYNRYATFVKFKGLAKNDLIKLRNQQNIRNHIGELCCLVCLSTKNKALSLPKVTSDHFNTEFMKSKFKACDSKLIEKYTRFGDPEELKIILNEFIHHLNTKNYDCAVYWISWLFEWEKQNIKNKKEYKCGYRSIINVENKYFTDMVWAIWEILINLETNCYINALFNLYICEYSNTKKTKKMPIILFAIKIYTDSHKVINQDVYNKNISTIIQVSGNINKLFIDKKNHEANNMKQMQFKIHQTNYLSHEKIVKEELEKKKPKNKLFEESLKKMNTLEELDTMFLNQSSR